MNIIEMSQRQTENDNLKKKKEFEEKAVEQDFLEKNLLVLKEAMMEMAKQLAKWI